MKNPKRIYWLDLTRIIAIYFVVLLHTFSRYKLNPNSDFFSTVISAVTLTGVPLFIILSGSLLLNRKEEIKVFFKNRTARILYPWIFWSVVYFYFEIFFGKISFDLSAIRFFYVIFMSRFWFMPLIASMYILTPVFRIFILRRKQFALTAFFIWILLIPIAGTVFVLSSNAFLEPNMVLIYSGYFLGGYLFFKMKNSRMVLVFTVFTLIISVLTSSLLFLSDIIPSGYFMSGNSIFLALSSFSILLIFKNLFGSFKPNVRLGKLVEKLSSMSLGIYLSHELVMLGLDSFTRRTDDVLYLFVLSLVIFSFSLTLVILLRKIFRTSLAG